MADNASPLLSALGVVGDVLDSPRRLVYGLGNAAYKGLTGDQGPDINHFSDVLERLGMDKDSMLTKGLGFAGDIATDPLTWAGGGLARAARSSLSGEALGALGKAAEGAALNPAVRETLEGVPAFRGAVAAPAPLRAAKAGATRAEGRTLAMSAPEDGMRWTASVKRAGNVPANQVGGAMDDFATVLGEPVAGMYSRDVLGGATVQKDLGAMLGADELRKYGVGSAEEANRQIGRHEAMHAMIDKVRQGQGNAASLPWAGRVAASLPGVADEGSGVLRALGLVADETAAHAAQFRGGANQARGGLNFLFSPKRNAEYAGAVKELDPLVGAAYGYLPKALVDAGYLTGGGLGAGARQLGG